MPEPDPANFNHEAAAVTYARKKAGLTRTQLAEQLGVALSLISQIESNKRNATPAMLLRMAEVLNCPVVILERKRCPHAVTAGDAA
jgi:transcriptional regulator with XRE-family HTH domain